MKSVNKKTRKLGSIIRHADTDADADEGTAAEANGEQARTKQNTPQKGTKRIEHGPSTSLRIALLRGVGWR